MNLLSDVRKALIARLQEIMPDSGFSTTAGSRVVSGWFNEVIKSSQRGFPLIVVQKGADGEPESGPGALRVIRGFYIIGAVDAGLDDYEDALDDLELDILRCIIPQGGAPLLWAPRGTSSIYVGKAEHVPPGDGEMTASVLIPVQFSLIIKQ